MPPKYEDYLAFEAAHRAGLAQNVSNAVGTIRTAAVHAEKLVGTPEWDQYQQQLQALQNDAQKQVDSLLDQLSSPATPWNADVVSFLRGMLALWQGRRDALKEAIMLPNTVIEAYRETKARS